mmetsp:Transcript_89245/g.158238  ORF Transcript_89245/g.158238 Transcript_89245/m.158238 type:complete len:516 (-) Transcript_89245:42-1589(-)|eukprot:CAMPEP_0197656836 /NCGR_PEP_ID=MMETSP1338-20131121/43619_1 /TAXON_ID=43686 ORGANISM="Pelagodinium beii, Strain RCC1491" /NCGR_SAMPLE_ID=MMETSP1338 /ASSEMBLY_ACC=CAM_ASM_000754 /LENGTH=515 /DNA_ID=CAMNT_0043233037 /DNA_START=129 /DNA_END=1676 /DNA_ORIENTATION=+
MGNGYARAVEDAVKGTGPGSAWDRRNIGPSLRRFFGLYFNGDIWACYRRYKNIDEEGTGWISYEELAEIVMLPEFNLLFIFDAFSQQNALIDSRELLVMICMFSSAKLMEKCKLMMTLFDASHSGTLTAHEVSHFANLSLTVLSRCTGVTFKPKELQAALQDEFADLLPEYQAAAERLGDDHTFKEERIVGQNEMDHILQSIMDLYEGLPLGQDPPEGAVPPPVPDWNHAAAVATATPTSAKPLGRRLTEAELAHLAVMGGLADEEADAEKAKQEMLRQQQEKEQKRKAAEAAKAAIKPAKAWMLIHGISYNIIARDMARFRHTFIHGVAQALSLPNGCVEILDIAAGSVQIEFLVHQAGRKGDQRTAEELLMVLAEQLRNMKSILRRGIFATYASSAELLAGPNRDAAAPPLALGSGKIQCDQGVQFLNPRAILDEILLRLKVEQEKADEAESKRNKVLLDLKRKEEQVQALKDLKDRKEREDALRQAEETRDADMKQFGEELRQLEELRKQQR